MPHATDNTIESAFSHQLIAFDITDTASPEAPRLLLLPVSSDSGTRCARLTGMRELCDTVAGMLHEEVSSPALDEARKLRELIAGLPGVVLRCGVHEHGEVDFISEQVVSLCGHDTSHLAGRGVQRLLALVHPHDRRRLMVVIQRALRDGSPFGIEHRILCASGEEKWVWHRGCVRLGRDAQPELESFVVDITERKYEEQQLTYLASHDPLTGVANRSNFIEQMNKSLLRAQRSNEMLACLFLDLDRFKQVNDSFGHGFGDELLRQASQRVRRCIRGNDLIGRFGGDEFTVLLDGIHERDDAVAAAGKILEELNRPYVIRGHRLALSASIGISCYPDDARDATQLLKNADAAMYDVKSSGRCGYRVFSNGMTSQSLESLSLTSGLRGAIESAQIQVFYQPRIDLATGRVAGLEALARWQSPEFGRVSPARFVALAEDVGLIGKLGEHMMRQACRQMATWDAQALPSTRVAVNISARQFRDERLVEQVKDILDETGLPAERLELEITETTMMQDHAVAAHTLQQLKELGVMLSVDDFGTGYSSLHLLKKFPLDFLKVHSSFIGGVPDDEDDVAITEAIIAMARRLNLRVVAEGIETEAQANFLRSSGCEEGQGFLFSRPLPESQVREYLGREVQ